MSGDFQSAYAESVINLLPEMEVDNEDDDDDDVICPFWWQPDLELYGDVDDGAVDDGYPYDYLIMAVTRSLAEETDANDVPELGLLEERAQYGIPRQFKVRSIVHSNWATTSIWSSAYPNGDQGDDLIQFNADNSRYMISSVGCGPTNYTLSSNAAKGAVGKFQWVCESTPLVAVVLSPWFLPSSAANANLLDVSVALSRAHT